MFITYERPDALGMQIDPAAPAADLDPTGAECAAMTYDVGGIEWHCTRRPNHIDDEHRAAFDVHGGGPTGAVGFAWQYEWGGAGHGPSSTVPMTTVTVTGRSRRRHGRTSSCPTRSPTRSAPCSGSATTTTSPWPPPWPPPRPAPRTRHELTRRGGSGLRHGEKRRDDAAGECAARYY